MVLSWTREPAPIWDEAKQRVLADLPVQLLGLSEVSQGQRLADEWWRVEDAGDVVGFGRLDDTWGDAEILVAVEPDSQGRGVGSYILENLEAEASRRGLNYVYNVVHAEHPEHEEIRGWFLARGFAPGTEEELRKRLNR
ncbi:MAG: GNAT family N-acetyltransferase [Actinomycetota bacterium]|nr:GNAT family N-acetyltransferase [Actinomycetota bacterium]